MSQKSSRVDISALVRYSCYDPLLGFSKEKSEIGGFDIWPEEAKIRSAGRFRIMVTGGSTSTWPGGEWSKALGKLAEKDGTEVIIFNGGMGGYSTSQELLKIIRDAPALQPDIILSMSGVNDFGFLHNVPKHPLIHRYQHCVARYLHSNNDNYSSWNAGVPDNVEAGQMWLRNIKMMKAVCDSLEIPFFSFLQPTMVYGGYVVQEDEKDLLNPQAYRTLETGRTYKDEVAYFYGQVLKGMEENPDNYSFVTDLTHAYEGKSFLYRDYRHQNDDGDIILAQRVYEVLKNEEVI